MALRHGGGDRIPFSFSSTSVSSTTSSLYSTSTATSSPFPSPSKNTPDSSSIQVCGKLAIAQIHELVALFGQGIVKGQQISAAATTSVAPATAAATAATATVGAGTEDECLWDP